MRHVADDQGRSWAPVAVPSRGAHLRMGATLGFRPADAPDAEPLLTSIRFNSDQAAALAIGSMSDWELRRRLGLAQAEVGAR
ncbi:MAG: hypothetical protein M3409_07625 [Gemmatimonadota bacterium]|nr:hypothetical protein [Gemmatimonadota bacterium]